MANSQTFTFNIKAVADMKDVVSNVQNIQNALKQLKLPTNVQESFRKTFGELDKELDKYQKLMAGGFKTKGDANALEKSGNNILHLYEKIVSTINSLDDSALKKAFADLGAKEVENLKNQLTQLQDTLKQKVSTKKGSFINLDNAKTQLADFKSKLTSLGDDADKAFKKLSNSTFNTFAKNLSAGNLDLAANNLKSMAESAAKVGDSKLIDWVQQLQDAFNNLTADSDIKSITKSIEQLKSQLSSAKATALQNLLDQFKQGKIPIENMRSEIGKLISDTTEWGKAQAQTNKELDQVKSRIQYFFGLNNAINLVRRAIRSAVSTIKELDKAMTETAVVTDFTVSDMWEQLPEYTKRANELGVTTLAAYKAATLYYQQGLKTNEVNALSVETLKMARIAGLDAAEATDRMTNALRGFNMALTEANAQRVDDVYSELAANTASNVDEISTAMTKVASLAHNANMEFETTAAFLSQIIETTRESAETAGTALKTVVARFSEVKKLVDENQIRGQDEEGQIIDVNRVGAALRTAGIDLNKYFIGEVGLDDIFMELASKWDSLTSIQQRYIATQAAGSRQQSRFIALMQDYARTQELVSKAYNANGASARQFEKTQESLESKLNRLKNAWNEFLMGITNSKIVKGFVDLLTNLLNIVNKLTNGFGDVTSSILKMSVAIATIKGGKALFNSAGFDSFLSVFTGKSANGEKAKGFGQLFAGVGKGIWGGAKNIGNHILGAGGSSGILAGLTGIATALGAVAAAVGVVVAGYQVWLHLTPEGQLKQAKQLAEAMNKTASETQREAEALKEVKKSYQEYNDTIKNAKTSKEYNDAIVNRNEYINSLLQENETLAQYVTASQENGQFVLTINEEQFSKAVENAAQGAAKAAIGANFANALQAGRQANVYEQQLALSNVNLKTGQITEYDSTGEASVRKLTDAEIKKYTDLQIRAQQARAQQENYAKMAFSQQLEGLDLEDDVANLLSGALAKGFNEAQYQSDINNQRWSNWINGRATKTELRSKYLELYGTQADSNMSRKQLAEAVAEAQIQQQQQTLATGAAAFLQGANGERYKKILAALNGTGELANSNLATLGIINENGGTTSEDLLDAIGFDASLAEEELANFEKALGLATGELKKYLKEQVKATKEVQEQQQKSTVEKMIANGYTPEQAARFLQLSSFDDQQIIGNLLTQLEESDFGPQIFESIMSAMEAGNWEDSSLQEWINSIDFSNPIASVQAIEEAVNNKAEPAIQKLAQSIKNSNDYILQTSKSQQVQYFLLSDSYEGLSDQLADFIKENDSISSSNIQELAKSNKDLKTLLDNNIVSAKGLASVLTQIEKGTIAVTDLNDAILIAASSMDDLGGVAKDTINTLNDFDPGYDENDVTGFITKVFDNATENIEKGAYGNNVMGNYMQKIFGEFEYSGSETGYKEAYKEWLKNNVKWLEDNKDNMYSAWKDFSDTLEDGMVGAAKVWEQGGEIFIEANGMTTDELVKAMVENSDLTEMQARMMITDFKNYSADFAHEMAVNDLPQAVRIWAEEVGDGGYYLEKDLDTLAEILGTKKEKIQEILKGYEDLHLNNLGEGTTKDILTAIATRQGQGGGVDLLNRPHIDTENLLRNHYITNTGGTATVFSQTFFDSDFKEEGAIPTKAITLTPILPDGSVISQEALAEYARRVFSGEPLNIDENLLIGEVMTGSGEELAQAAEKYSNSVHVIQAALDGEVTSWEELQQAMMDNDLGQYFDQVVNDLLSVGDTFETKFGEVEIQAGESAEKAYQRIKEEWSRQQLAGEIGDAIKNAIGDKLQIEFLDLNTTIEDIDTIQDYIENLDPETKITFVDENGNKIERTVADLKAQLSEPVNKTIKLSADKSTLTFSDAGGSGLVTIKIGMAAIGGIVRSLAAGSSDHFLQPGFALTGEEGAEIVWNKEKGYAYVTGKNGPQFQNLQPGDRVFNAQETSRIFRNSSFAKGGIVPSYASGYGDANKNKNGGGGSGSAADKEKEEKWKNEVDWLYNLVEDIAELERVQTKLQEDYEDYLIDEAKTGKDLYNLLIQQLGNLYTQLDHQTFALEKREQEMREFMDTTNKYDDYLWYNWEDRTLEIDWDQIEAIKASDKETYDEIVDLISEAESIQDKMDDAEDSVMDIKNQIQELEDIWRDTFTDFEDRVYSAIVKEYQTVIDNYSELNETLNNSNNAILSALQRQISLERQIRDNTKTEEEIGDTEAQLAFLRRDTSGGNELAALQLEQQLNDSRQSYEDNLVDQAISRLQEDNDAAAQQREHQIEIMQAQLDYQSQSGEFNAMVLDLLNSAMGADGELLTNSDLVALLKTQENWGAMSAVSKQVWEEELNTTFKEVAAFLLKQNAEENGTFVTALTGALGAVNATIGSYSQGMMKYLNSSSSSGGGGSGGSKNTGGGGSSEWYWYGNDTDKAGVVSSPTGTLVDTRTINGTTYYYYEQGNGAQYVYKRQKKSKGYATGGLNTSTGLAWLDGTKSEPEYVLNARQTDAFLRLADVLPNIMSNQSQVTNTFGGVNLNLVMNVDQIASDYDVDRIADRVKDIIYDVGSYRNVNTLNFSR